jgi:hypothetical protein
MLANIVTTRHTLALNVMKANTPLVVLKYVSSVKLDSCLLRWVLQVALLVLLVFIQISRELSTVLLVPKESIKDQQANQNAVSVKVVDIRMSYNPKFVQLVLRGLMRIKLLRPIALLVLKESFKDRLANQHALLVRVVNIRMISVKPVALRVVMGKRVSLV